MKLYHEPDGTFPNGVPNPMLEQNHAPVIEARAPRRGPTWASPGTATTTAASSSTRQGTFIEGYYIVGLLASVFLKRDARRADRA